MSYYLLAFLITLVVALILGPLVIAASKKIKASQTVLEYVKEHSSKSGTPTLGGIIFIVASLTSLCFFTKNYTLAIIALASMFAYGILGFLDDFIKIRYKQNLGLKPYQKIIGQVGIATILAFFCYYSNLVGTTIYLPFVKTTIDLSWGVIPFIILIYLAVTNSVNLTDGLDGLAAGVSTSYLIGFVTLLFLYQKLATSTAMVEEFQNLIMLCFCVIGALIGYMSYNCFPAKIFMGDTGSLALGGLIASLAIFSRLELYIPLLGIMFVISALSVILQVLHYKRTKKRIFKMAPIHHHFQQCGVHENRITLVYIVITIMMSSLVIIISIFAGGLWKTF